MTGTDTAISTHAAGSWLRRWDTQQEIYVADREERFAVLCDVVEATVADVAEPVIVDLGCGPGSLSGRLSERLPHATVIGIDQDPLLLGLATAHYGSQIKWVDADLAQTGWQEHVPATIHVAVSTTALHWLKPDKLAALYRVLGSLITPGGVFVNGDHMGFGDKQISALAETVRERRAVRAGVRSNEDWQAWWAAAEADPDLARLAQARGERLALREEHHGSNGLTVAEHTELLWAAGFSSVEPLWQVGDDHVLAAVR